MVDSGLQNFDHGVHILSAIIANTANVVRAGKMLQTLRQPMGRCGLCADI